VWAWAWGGAFLFCFHCQHQPWHFIIMLTLPTKGGDVIKFAGDAAIVIWPSGEEPLSVRCLRAIHCAFDIQAWLEVRYHQSVPYRAHTHFRGFLLLSGF
jgi:hypothetical protein